MEYSTLIAEDGVNKAHIFDSTEDAVHACHWEDNVKIGDTLVVESEGVVGLAIIVRLQSPTKQVHSIPYFANGKRRAHMHTSITLQYNRLLTHIT